MGETWIWLCNRLRLFRRLACKSWRQSHTGSGRFRIDWKTVGRLVSQVWHELEADPPKHLEGLEYIGIDETSYTKGHNYFTLVVNHATNAVVWVAKDHGKEVFDQFFQILTKEQREAIKAISVDGAII